MKVILALTWLAWPGYASAQAPTLDSLARSVQRVESVREIKDLTRSFCQLAQFAKWTEMASLFSENGTLRIGDINSDTVNIKGPVAIENWLRADAGDMNGILSGSLNTWLADQPVTTLSTDGKTAKARWLTFRMLGDGKGSTRMEGGIFENDYALHGSWKIDSLHYFPEFNGTYEKGWGNWGKGRRSLPIIPYHYTPDTAGIPILGSAADKAAVVNVTVEELAARIARLNDEDQVRNLQHTYGFYVDRRMWSDIVGLFATNATITADGHRFDGDIRTGMLERMGPENLTQGVLNDHPIFDTIVDVSPDGREAVARGIELGMMGNANTRAATWEFNIFRNQFVKDAATGIWKISGLDVTHLVAANYTTGWGKGGINPSSKTAPAFLDITRRKHLSALSGTTDLSTLQRLLSRSAAYDNVENISGAYGYFADDIRCQAFADLHHTNGHKESPGAGWFRTVDRIAQACLSRYNTYDPNPQRPRVPFHWRPQPVILVSQDGRSASCRARLLQWGTSNETLGGFSGVSGFNGGMYHDQMALETKNGTARWKLWSLTIDEFYWQSPTWEGGWAAANPRKPGGTAEPSPLIRDYPPDLVLTDPGMGDREVGLPGGKPPLLNWPDIKKMWFAFRNPVTGKLPEAYWPGCVPCKAKPTWALTANGYQEPPTGPTLVTVESDGKTIGVKIVAGPGEEVVGTVGLWEAGKLVASAAVTGGAASFPVPQGNGMRTFTVTFPGSDRLAPGQGRVTVPAALRRHSGPIPSH